jgi:multidrug resistance efflux pump
MAKTKAGKKPTKAPSKKKINLDKDPEVIAKNRLLTKLLSNVKSAESEIQANYDRFKRMDKTLTHADTAIDKINISSLHDSWALDNDKQINNASNVIKEIASLRKQQYSKFEKLEKLNHEVKQARIDVLLAKINCLDKSLDEPKK